MHSVKKIASVYVRSAGRIGIRVSVIVSRKPPLNHQP